MPPEVVLKSMGLKWNEETWYSRIGTIIVIFAAIPVLCFDIGVQYWQAQIALTSSAEIPGVNYPHPISSLESTVHGAATSSPATVE